MTHMVTIYEVRALIATTTSCFVLKDFISSKKDVIDADQLK